MGVRAHVVCGGWVCVLHTHTPVQAQRRAVGTTTGTQRRMPRQRTIQHHDRHVQRVNALAHAVPLVSEGGCMGYARYQVSVFNHVRNIGRTTQLK